LTPTTTHIYTLSLHDALPISGLFVPIQYDGRTLVDGFLTAPVPLEGTLLLGADIVIAVYLEAGNVEQPRTFTDVLSRAFNILQRSEEHTSELQSRSDLVCRLL